jgi:hypothetical protein
MRTTVDLDEDVLGLLKQLAKDQHKPVGKVVSEIVRKELTRRHSRRTRNGILLLEPGNRRVPLTLEEINRIRDEA